MFLLDIIKDLTIKFANRLNPNLLTICHDQQMLIQINPFHITGVRHICATGFSLIRFEICDGYFRLLRQVLLNSI